ncbi:hypothetical protein JG687_00011156 [Phytophthora cactorum]|uniref:BZIP domain-containing protein n=1 Tax=Phytophthora cactorum TaxID=29920 RepID=A0A8T1U9X1_9STRA|nr:hypothetical protein JG687_00011156 [Phytophthora cactorum]
MESISSFDSALFNGTAINCVPTTLPVVMPLKENCHKGDQHAATPSRNTTTKLKRETAEEFAKIEKRRVKDRIRRRKTILRRKCEREALNWEITELSKQVDLLKRKIDVDTSASAPTCRKTQELQALTDERRYLRDEVRKQAGLINDIYTVFHDQLGPTDLTPALMSNGKVSERISTPCLEHSEPRLIQQYVRELVDVYKQTASIFPCATQCSPQSSVVTTTRETQNGTEFFQSYGTQMMPFEYRQTCHYLWQLVILGHRQEDRQIYREVEDPENTLALRFRLQGASLVVHHAIRRFQEKDRTVLVWRALTEGEGVFSGMHTDETGWCVVHSSAMDSCAIVETCSRVVPMHIGAAASRVSVAEQFTSIVIKSIEEDILQISMKLDKLLLDEALEHIHVEDED